MIARFAPQSAARTLGVSIAALVLGSSALLAAAGPADARALAAAEHGQTRIHSVIIDGK